MTDDTAQHSQPSEPPKVLTFAMPRVSADLEYASALAIRVVTIQIDRDSLWEVIVAVRNEGTGLFVDTDAPLEEVVVSLADQLQTVLFEDAWSAVPKCPLHEHPLSPQVRSGQARWECPASSDAWSCPIGQLAEALS